MDLPNSLVSQFAKLSKNQNESNEKTVYGTTVAQGDKLYVNIDGSDSITPVVSMSDIKPGERVSVLIKDHTATIIGNITNPSAGTEEVGKVLDEYDTIIAKIGNFELLIADKVTTEQLEASLAIIDTALIGKASVAELDAVKATIKNLDVSKLEAEIARIDKAIIDKADVTDLNAVYAEIDLIKGDVGEIETLIGGHLTMDNIQSLVLTSSKVTVDNAFIKDAMIDRVSASKLYAGTIDTDNVNIQSSDGSMTITGSIQQFKDSNGKVRIQIGKDSSGDFTFILYGEDGNGQLINQNGITASAISDGLIVNKMVADNAAISGSKLDIDSVITSINNGTTTIKGTRIYLDDKNQTLSAAFNTMTSTINDMDDNIDEITETLNSQSTSIKTINGQINTLISNTTITKEDGSTVSLKDEYSSLGQTVNSLNVDMGVLETNYSNDIKTVNSKLSTYEQTLTGFETSIRDVTTVTNNLSNSIDDTNERIDNLDLETSSGYTILLSEDTFIVQCDAAGNPL